MFAVQEMAPTIPAEAARELFKQSNGNVTMKQLATRRGWERQLHCEDCNKTQSVESLIVLAKDDEQAFSMILKFCNDHRHGDMMANLRRDEFATVKTDTARRVKEI